MNIVIEITDVDYEYIKNGCIIPIKYDNTIYHAIRNGTPLEDYCESCIYTPTESEDD